jgi:hypothetical protein
VVDGEVHVNASKDSTVKIVIEKGKRSSFAEDRIVEPKRDMEKTEIDELNDQLNDLMEDARVEDEETDASAEDKSIVEDDKDKGKGIEVKTDGNKTVITLKTEAAIKAHYNKLEQVTLDDGTVLVGAVIYQNKDIVRIHTVHGIIKVPTSSVSYIKMK